MERTPDETSKAAPAFRADTQLAFASKKRWEERDRTESVCDGVMTCVCVDENGRFLLHTKCAESQICLRDPSLKICAAAPPRCASSPDPSGSSGAHATRSCRSRAAGSFPASVPQHARNPRAPCAWRPAEKEGSKGRVRRQLSASLRVVFALGSCVRARGRPHLAVVLNGDGLLQDAVLPDRVL